ncbi:uncharacterized protein LOC131317344 [Rhododendron vialii]|uniref:uncharacterized protein LOC131317344 n=1 Tax=Rhododendron vialii TaxID=182163 RepID=UPI0026604CEF|nr:uncharacterized protein LOC131317344 [Rhododendron vialii]
MNVEEAVYARRTHDGFDPQAGPSQVGEFPPPDKKRTESTRKTGGEPKNKKVDSRLSPKREEREDCPKLAAQASSRRKRKIPIIFSEEDIKGVRIPHDDPLVITIVRANYITRRVLIDSGSSVDILYLHAYDQLKVGRERLRPMTSPSVGFAGTPVYPAGQIALPITIGGEGSQITRIVDFIVVDCPSAYNAILGRTTLNKIGAIISTYHLMIKFPTSEGVACVRGDQKAARECYVTSLRRANITMNVESLDTRDEEKLQHGEPVEELVEELLEPGQPGKTVRMGI